MNDADGAADGLSFGPVLDAMAVAEPTLDRTLLIIPEYVVENDEFVRSRLSYLIYALLSLRNENPYQTNGLAPYPNEASWPLGTAFDTVPARQSWVLATRPHP